MKNKKFLKLFLILILFTCFKYQVKAVDENNNNESEEVGETKSSDATLKDVVVNNNKVICSNYVCEYIIEDNSVSEVTITYKTNHEKATVSKDKIEEKIKFGLNEFKVTVKAEDETEKEYTFKITKKELSTDSSLKIITVNGTNISLTTNNLKYNTSVSNADKKIELEAIPSNDKATLSLVDDKKIKFNNNKINLDFFDDSKTIKILVTSEAGDSSTYTITVTRREEMDATLKSLTIKNAKLEFESGVFDYETTVLKSVDSLEIEAIATDSNAKVEIKNANNLVIGENTVTILVTNDGNTKTYTIKVTKLEQEDKSLANLKSLKIDGYTLDFKEDKYEYDLKIGDVNYLSIEALPLIDGSEVEITGNADLVDGSIIKIKVLYDDETYNVYKINISKEVAPVKNNTISKIVIIAVIFLIIIAIIIVLIIQIKNKNKKTHTPKKNTKKEGQMEDKINDVIEKVEESEKKKANIITLDEEEEIEDII